ncbi:MAG: HAMP domain-containing sensor histidine kinase [Elainellaceae cyanobacterium]
MVVIGAYQAKTSLGATSPQFRALCWQLLFSYLGVMTGVVSISTLVVYQVVAHTLYRQIDQQLVSLADAAAHNLRAIQTNQSEINTRVSRSLDDDGDLDIPWQDLQETHQSIEWFDANKQLLGKAGRRFPDIPLRDGFHVLHHNALRTLTIPVYLPQSAGLANTLAGYVRVSESGEEVEEELERLLIGLGVGGAIAIVLIGGTGWWLTQRSIQPIEQNVIRLQQFTADASHELRSPLTAIRTSIEVMQSHPERVHPADSPKLEAIANATAQMTQLVEDLLLLARTDTTAPPLKEYQTIPLDELLEDLMTFLEPQAEAKTIQLDWSGVSTSIQIRGNAAQLRRMFANLVENAVQYTSAGGNVRISTYLAGGTVVVSIKDTGIGIAPEHIPYLFDRFWRADQARSRRVGGAGLGLAIAQAIAQAHAGEITVISQINVGSCFQVKLPKL